MFVGHIMLITVPLFFSHIFSRVGIIFGDESSFERMKVFLFLLLTICFMIEAVIQRSDMILETLKKWWIILILLIILPLCSYVLSGDTLATFFLGSYEKHHGYLFWLGVLFFTLFLSLIPDKRALIRTSLFTAGGIALIGIIEFFGLYFTEMTEELTWGVGRIVSTLGNPNYVAGYLLIHLPLIKYLEKRWQSSLLHALLIVGIFLTGSYIAIALMLLYSLITLSRKLHTKGPLIVIFTSVLGIISMWQIIPGEKKLSLETRGVLMMETFRGASENPIRFFLGHGPDSIVTYFSGPRNEKVRDYIPDEYTIDSSHSIFIDIIYSYGIIIFALLGWMIVSNLPNIDTPARNGLVMGLIFFGANVIVLAPLLVMILLGTMKKS